MNTSVGLLPLYLELYEDIDPTGREEYREYLSEMSALISAADIELVNPGIIFTKEQLNHAEDMFAENQVEAVVLLHLCYSQSLLIADYLEESVRPFLIIDSTPDSTLDPTAEGVLRRDQAIHGVMDLTSVLRSRGIKPLVVAGHRGDGGFQKKLRRALQALRAAGSFRDQRIGLTGNPFVGMGDFSIAFDRLVEDFGTRVIPIPVEQLAEVESGVPHDEVNGRIARDRSTWDTSEISEEEHELAARGYLALRKIVHSESLTGYTMNFQHIGDSIPTPFYGCSGLISDGYGYGGEGDVLTATLGRPLNMLAPAAKFDEFFCPDWEGNTLLMSHMGESDSRFIKSGSNPALVTREGFMNPHRSVIYRFQAEPGEVTFVNLSPYRAGGYRMVAGLLDIVDSELMERVVTPHYKADPGIPLPDFLEQYASAGGGHHIYVCRGNIMEEIGMFCRLLGFEFETIGSR